MGGGPAELKKLMNRWAEEQHARQAQKAAAARKAEDMADFRRQLLLKGAIDVTQSAYELDKHYGRDWDRASLQRMANDPSLSMEKRAKLVEIMILRGANNDMPYAQMRDMPRDFDFMGINGADLNEKASYQLAAQNAVMAGGDPMIWHLSN
ncbi:MAG TPA: hypothetical protein VFO85_08015, partial [Vicinamibacteria bacterium]|nr:hypothetical protein [Vicinamibacteria bacterium]